MKTIRWFPSLLIIIAGAGSSWAAGDGEGQNEEGNFFDETVKIIIPYGAGGTHDVVSRRFAEVGSRYTNAPIIVET